MCKGPKEGKSLVCWRNDRDQCAAGARARGEQQMSLEVTGLQVGQGHCKTWDSGKLRAVVPSGCCVKTTKGWKGWKQGEQLRG